MFLPLVNNKFDYFDKLMQNNNKQLAQLYAAQVIQNVLKHHYKRVVLQLPKHMLSLSFDLVSFIRKHCADVQFYVLYDSLKQSCCTDVLGAEHVNYDGLIHFGKACFSQLHRPNHHYIFQLPPADRVKQVESSLKSQELIDELQKNQVGYVLSDQRYYQLLKTNIFTNYKLGETNIELLKLPYDKEKQDEYIVFGYHGSSQGTGKNMLIISDEQESQGMTLAEQLMFALKGIAIKVGKQLFTLNFQQHKVEPLSLNQNKLLMQRYSLISQLDKYNFFGLIVSNTSTQFHKRALTVCKQVLKKQGKKTFTFMMNNLNEVKLGNFLEIQVYVIISCYNHSIFSLKEFHRLVVTPNDLMVAFEGRQFDHYVFDFRVDSSEIIMNLEQKEDKAEKGQAGMQLDKAHNNTQLMLQQKIQTLQYYRQRQFKGLQFSQKKEVKKMTKGKIGLAESYKPLE